jgi:hypothetical protein
MSLWMGLARDVDCRIGTQCVSLCRMQNRAEYERRGECDYWIGRLLREVCGGRLAEMNCAEY